MSGFNVSTTTRFEGQWLFTAHIEPPLYPGLSIRYRGRTYQIADDCTLKVKFSATESADAHAVTHALSSLIDRKCAEIKAKVLAKVQDNSEALYNALTLALYSLERACEGGFTNEYALQHGAKLLLSLGDKARAPLISKSESRVRKHLAEQSKRLATATPSAT